MKLFTAKQISDLDRFTIACEPVSELDLMERAATRIACWLAENFDRSRKMIFFAGPGNNGGDALAAARLLADLGFSCEVYIPDLGRKPSASFAANHDRLVQQGLVALKFIGVDNDDFPDIAPTGVIVDGLFGTGLNRRIDGFAAEVVQKINGTGNTVVSIDIPSGLMPEDNEGNSGENIVRADFTLTLHIPKISFLLAGNEGFVGRWEVLPIGLHPEGIRQIQSDFFFVEREDIRGIIRPRPKFAHKGMFGHALLVAGSFGKMGAAVLASMACLRAGAGLLTAHVPGCGYEIIQSSVPEAMASVDACNSEVTELPAPDGFAAIGIGPGLDTKKDTQTALRKLIENAKAPMVIDADALNILSENREWLAKLPENSILTPHVGEFNRLAGNSENSYERMMKQIAFAIRYKVVVVLKGAFTTVATPAGRLFFNSTGNPGMATAGSGDVLTGIILGLLAQNIEPAKAATAGVFIHGLAGDMAASELSEHALVAGDIVAYTGKAFLSIMK